MIGVILAVLGVLNALVKLLCVRLALRRSPHLVRLTVVGLAMSVVLTGGNTVAGRWMALLWLAVMVADVVALVGAQRAHRLRVAAAEERHRAELVAGLPPEDREWLSLHQQLADGEVRRG